MNKFLVSIVLFSIVCGLNAQIEKHSSKKPAASTSMEPSPAASTSTKPSPASSTSVKPSPAASTSTKPSPAASTSVKPSHAASTSTKPSPASSTSVKPSPAASTSTKPSPAASTSVKPSPAASTSVKPSSAAASTSVKPSSASTSVKPSSAASTSSLPASSTSMKPSASSVHPSISSNISPSASSHAPPASSSQVPTKPPTTTPQSTKKPIHYDVDVVFSDEKKNNTPCLWFRANVNLTYQITGENTTTTLLLDNKHSTLQGVCSDLNKANDQSVINLNWPDHTFTALFMAKSDGSWYFQKLAVSVTQGENVSLAEKEFKENENTQFLRAEKKHIYSCLQTDPVILDSKNGTFSLNFHEIEVQPFANAGVKANDTDTCSSKSESSSSSSIVPIAVGCALAGLIVIVLIAYLIGRRKNDGRSYQQV